ncbi:hypothetical protein J27TS7_22950 [Paenibacillus dendritiformis]|uniref:hypothetical protein n=1 Tax=Paenibacillus dendritiformis TaxID=130049 RepID=UPI001B090E9C|nr:hypothetical protein [Paenibacillus dendritiformis]GIO72781.1 hypothetical protein J27TS7_22950 [Paenibacillus dendritiformis]
MGTLPNPDDLRDMLAQVMRLLDGQGLSDKELVLTEWPIRELKNDTVDKAAYLAKTIATVLHWHYAGAFFAYKWQMKGIHWKRGRNYV